MDFWTLYLIELLDAVNGLAIFSCAVSIIVLILAAVAKTAEGDCNDDPFCQKIRREKWHRYAVAGLIFTIIVGVFVPTSNQVYKIVGGYYLTNINDIEKLPENVVGAINQFLEEYQPKVEAGSQ